MGWQQIASGNLLDAGELLGYEASGIDEGQRGLLSLDLRAAIPQSIVSQLQNELKQRGVAEAQVSTGSPILNISWRKGSPWLGVIVAAILGLIVLAILIVGWRLFREVVETLGTAGGWLVIAAVIGIIAVGTAALRRARNG